MLVSPFKSNPRANRGSADLRAVSKRVDLVQDVDNFLILGGVRRITKILVSRKRLLDTLDNIVLRTAGRIVADYCAGWAGRGGDPL
jgi:hypothetical protein